MNNLCWIRRDLRLHDHAALAKALSTGETTVVFIFDKLILDKLIDKHDRRLTFIYESLKEIESEVQKKGSSLLIRYGDPVEEIPKLSQELKIKNVFCNRDYEPYAKERDSKVDKKLASLGVNFEQFKDSVLFEKKEFQNALELFSKIHAQNEKDKPTIRLRDLCQKFLLEPDLIDENFNVTIMKEK
jgi:deoxyribodipyrimidine photo-lyase